MVQRLQIKNLIITMLIAGSYLAMQSAQALGFVVCYEHADENADAVHNHWLHDGDEHSDKEEHQCNHSQHDSHQCNDRSLIDFHLSSKGQLTVDLVRLAAKDSYNKASLTPAIYFGWIHLTFEAAILNRSHSPGPHSWQLVQSKMIRSTYLIV